jgi:hypothetical protein
MEIARWLLLIVLACSFGVLYVGFLTTHPLKMSRYLFAATLVFCVAVVLLAGSFRGTALLIAVVLALLSALGGYAVMTRRFLSREDPRPVPELERTIGDRGQGHTAIVYFTHGEPETYNPVGWINQFRE